MTTEKITKQKLSAAIRPPREIRDQTNIRRQWIADKVAEITKDPTKVCKVVGGGSYQEIKVYDLIEVEARVQIRGSCQCCGADQAIEKDGVLTRHGYERPGDGYLRGMCPGRGYRPAEKDVTLTKQLIAGCKLTMESLAQRMTKAGMTFAPGKYSGPRAEPRWQLTDAAERAPYFHPTSEFEKRMGHKERVPTPEQEERIRQTDMKRMWEANKEHAEFMTTSILPRLGQDLIKRYM